MLTLKVHYILSFILITQYIFFPSLLHFLIFVVIIFVFSFFQQPWKHPKNVLIQIQLFHLARLEHDTFLQAKQDNL